MSAHIDSIKIPLLSAFPNGNKTPENMGLTMRDYFAIHAPLPNYDWWNDGKNWNESSLQMMVKWKYEYADAMMKAREE